MAGGNPACLLARAKLAQHVASLRRSSFTEKAGAVVKAGYLASAKTIERNDVGNAIFGGFEHLVTKPLAVAMDYIHSVAKSAMTGGDVKPSEFRTLANTLDAEGFRQGWLGIKEGTAQAVQLLRTGVDAEQMAQRFEHEPTTFDSPTMNRVVNGVFNVMEANDKPFYNFAMKTSLYGRAKLLAIREGLSGEALRARTNVLLANPTDEMMAGAILDADYATFKNETSISRFFSGARRANTVAAEAGNSGAKLANLATDVILPFTKVPSAVLKAGWDYSPGGFFEALAKAHRGEVAAALTQTARATTGTALLGAGYALAKHGLISGSRPSNNASRAQNDVENIPANSVKIGDTWHSILFLGPLSIPLLAGANIHGTGDEGGLDRLAGAGSSIIKTTTEQSYLQGVSNVLDALNDPTGRGPSAIAGLIPFPTIVSQAAGAIDPVQRQSTGVAQRLQSKIPFASKSLAPRLTQFGDTAKKNAGGLRGAAQSFFDITNSRPDKSDDVTREMDRLGVAVNSFGKVVKIDDQTIKRTPDEYAKLLAEFGPIKRDALRDLINSPDYKGATDEGRIDMLKDELRDAQKVGNDVDKERRTGLKTPRVTPTTYLRGDF